MKAVVIAMLISALFVLPVSVFAAGGGGPAASIRGYAYLDMAPAENSIVRVHAPDNSVVSIANVSAGGKFGPSIIDETNLNDGDALTFTIDGYPANGSIIYQTGMGGKKVTLYANRTNCTSDADKLTVTTDKGIYNRGESVIISGVLRDETCSGREGVAVALQVKTPADSTLFVDQVTTQADGSYEYAFTLAQDATAGTYRVIANADNVTKNTTFEVQVCVENWECTQWEPSVCDANETQTRTCTDLNSCGTENEKPEETQSCECEPVWECSEWSECSPDGTQTRTCIDTWCGSENRTETQNCTYVPPCADKDLRFSVSTDREIYNQGETVTITGALKDETCSGREGVAVALQVKTPADSTLFVDQVTTQADGSYEYAFTLAQDAMAGTYRVIANADNVTKSTTFEVQVCIENWECTQWSMCLPGNQQIRTCTDLNSCGTEDDKPNETKECNFTAPESCEGYYIEVSTDREYYEGNSIGAVYGYILDDTCSPVDGETISLASESGSYNLFAANVVSANGVFTYNFNIGANDPEGPYTVVASSNQTSNETAFQFVQSCDADGDGREKMECGGDDCNDENANVYPGASCSTSCENAGATYNDECACAGGTNTCSPPTGGGGGGAVTGGGGGSPPPRDAAGSECTPEWECTDWSPATCPPTGMQTRICSDKNNCGKPEGRPDVARECVYISEGETPESVCGDGVCDEDETCSTCQADCGACPIAPSGIICGNGICESGENCESCEADCGECPKPQTQQQTGGLAGLIPGGTAGLGGIAILIVSLILVGYLYKTRNKSSLNNDDD